MIHCECAGERDDTSLEHRKFRLCSGSSPEYGCYVKPQRGAPRWGDFKLCRPPRARLTGGPMGAEALRHCASLGRGRAWAIGVSPFLKPKDHKVSAFIFPLPDTLVTSLPL